MGKADPESCARISSDTFEGDSPATTLMVVTRDESSSIRESMVEDSTEFQSTAARSSAMRNFRGKSNKHRKLGIPMSPPFQALAKKLFEEVDFFRLNTPKLLEMDHIYYLDTDIPEDIDWASSSSITDAFPPIQARGKMVVPLAIVLEAEEVKEKLVVINFWRLLRTDEQRQLRDTIRAYYLRPSISKERLNLNIGTRTIQAKGDDIGLATPTVKKIAATDPENIEGPFVRKHQGFSKAMESLMNRVRFFTEVSPLDKITRLRYTKVPENIDWENSECVNKAFPPLFVGKIRDVPLCMLLESESDDERLVVVNWWRYLDSIQQPIILQELRRFYRAPTQSKDLMRQLHDVRDRRKERENAATWGFRCITSCQQLASKLKLTCDMLQTANLEPDTVCKSEGCIYPAMCSNGGFCCRHRISFAPLAGKERRKRGHFLLGPAYTKPNARLCSCNSDICVGIGFSDTMIRFDVTKLSPDLQLQVWNEVIPKSRKTACLAPWHFHPQHRILLPNGSWKLIEYHRTTTFKCPVTGKEWYGLPPPTYHVELFLEEPEMQQYNARKKTNLLPVWVREYQRLEEGPISLAEEQTNLLWERIACLEEKISTQALDFESSYTALEKEMKEHKSKCKEKKSIKGEDSKSEKRKRSDMEMQNSNKKKTDFESEKGVDQIEDTTDYFPNRNDGVPVHLNQFGAFDQNVQPLLQPIHTANAGQHDHSNTTYPPYCQQRVRYTENWQRTNVRSYY